MLLASLLAVYATSALADRIIPPKQFDHPAPNARVVNRSPDQIARICQKHSPWASGVGACALYSGKNKPCIILWPQGVPKSGVLWRHERAHCNGWPSIHP